VNLKKRLEVLAERASQLSGPDPMPGASVEDVARAIVQRHINPDDLDERDPRRVAVFTMLLAYLNVVGKNEEPALPESVFL